MAQDGVSITDNRTGKKYEIPILDGAVIRASDLRQIKVSDDDFGLMSYDPAFMNTASCRSAITFIEGDRGTLEYRGYPIAQLAEHSSFLEVAYLVINGELPTQSQLKEFVHNIKVHTIVHENIKTSSLAAIALPYAVAGKCGLGGEPARQTLVPQATLATAEPTAAAFGLERLAADGSPTEPRSAEIRPWIGCRRHKTRAILRPLATRRREPRAVAAPRPIFGGVDAQFTAVDLLAVKAPDGLRRLGFAGELDERESARTAGFPVGADVHVLHLPGG